MKARVYDHLVQVLERYIAEVRVCSPGQNDPFIPSLPYISVHNFVMEAMASNRMWSFMNF